MGDVLEATVLRVQSWTSRAKARPVRLWRPRALPAAPAPARTPPRPRLADPPVDIAASPLLNRQRGAGQVVSSPEAKLVVRARLGATAARGSGLTGAQWGLSQLRGDDGSWSESEFGPARASQEAVV